MAWKNSAKIKAPRRWQRDLWVGFKPYGIGETKPNAYREMARTVWDNRRNLRYAWRILRKGVCDGCALGVAGFHDWTLSGVHLCTTRLSLLKVNTMARSIRRSSPTRPRCAAEAIGSCATSGGSPSRWCGVAATLVSSRSRGTQR